jgi:hypothetical protein
VLGLESRAPARGRKPGISPLDLCEKKIKSMEQENVVNIAKKRVIF